MAEQDPELVQQKLEEKRLRLDAIERAIATGTLQVRDKHGREKRFRSLREMRSIRDELRLEVGDAPAPSARRGIQVHYPTYKGLL